MTSTAKRISIEPVYPVLPGTLQRSYVEGLLFEVRRALGLTQTECATLIAMIRMTPPTTWTDPYHEPLCFAQQQVIAYELGITARAVRAHELHFERLGLLQRRLANDGSRNKRAGQGICFSPLIEQVPHLLALRDLAKRDVQDNGILRRACSGLRRDLRHTLTSILERDPVHPEALDLLAISASFPARFDAYPSNIALREHQAELGQLVDKAELILEMLSNESGMSDQPFRRHTENTTDENLEICISTGEIERTACKQADDKFPRAVAIAPAKCIELKDEDGKAGVKTQGVGRFSPSTLAELASEEYGFYLSSYKGGRAETTWRDFHQTSLMMLRELGINQSAWDEAEDLLGSRDAAIAVFIIDCNRSHPTHKIANPGGYLRGMVSKARNGSLNLPGSLIRLLNHVR